MQTLVDSKSIVAASTHRRLPGNLHLYVVLFLPLYPIWLSVYVSAYEQFLGSEEWTFLTLGGLITINLLTFLVAQWSVTARVRMTCVSEPDVTKANVMRIVPVAHKGKGTLCNIEHTKNEVYFLLHQKKYIYDSDRKMFRKITYPADGGITMGEMQRAKGLHTASVLEHATETYGHNRFDIPLPTFQELFKEHAVAPFFVFQVFCVGLWCLDEYWYYSMFTLVMLVGFESTVVTQRLRTLKEFRTFSLTPFKINVYRRERWVQINSDELLPGDVCSIVRSEGDMAIPCDMLLLDGACIVNEAMLSGESTPQGKESIVLRESHEVLDANGNDRVHTLFGGTKVLQVNPPTTGSRWSTPDGGCIAYVLRTGFGTSQGKLVRTMVFNTEHVSANNMEAFLFIGFLLIFAIIAAGYVWVIGKSRYNEDRKRSKLVLDCIMIVTSVVPPELPMELSLAVNTSLIALSKYAIYCTEPFRIPFAGKVDICCFDKTGTLTGENLVVEGVGGIGDEPKALIAATDTPHNTIMVLAAAQALVQLDKDIIGDPMEKATLEAIHWKLDKDTVSHKDAAAAGGQRSLKIRRRFQFSSALKRMATLSSISDRKGVLFAAVKGAPETLQHMYTNVPSFYEDTYKYFTRRGSRVLALGFKLMESTGDVNNVMRESVESGLTFAGFLVFHCPLKEDSKKAVDMLNKSAHRVVMITGDNPLTACHVAKELDIVERNVLILDKDEDDETGETLAWRAIDDSHRIPVPADGSAGLDVASVKDYDLCLTGGAIRIIQGQPIMRDLLSRAWVYARVSPGQKEYILTSMKAQGYTTLMCGDGTNDVGALKQSHVGVALLDGKPEDLERIAKKQRIERFKQMYEQQCKMAERFNMPRPPPPPAIAHLYPNAQLQQNANMQDPRARAQAAAQQRMVGEKHRCKKKGSSANGLLGDLDDEAPTIKLGDASVAAPFTSKLSTVMSICNIIRQGRCTLVATLQMYKILALNCLISAFSLSVLYLDGIKYGDWQVTISGMMMAVCFLCISRAKPLESLSEKRPQTNIFSWYLMSSLLGQFAVHIASLVYVLGLSKSYEKQGKVDLDGEFEPTLLNSAIYLISLSMQVSTFAINYQGHPFRESLRENKTLYNGLVVVGGIALCGAAEVLPDMNNWLQLVPFPRGFSERLTAAVVLDFGVSYAIERTANYLFYDSRPKDIARREVQAGKA
ncbi:hypothetical protein THASP1DRAFT_34310 [Thamnocephalis sphaerospora]|uniref:Uncharacterized protein n=1 Tax=Thamnocephalis sphaerospora TaxID=78915 RepID=A0A4P9XUD5_9FUNG|nr:hypothetical protein THASP1DRAFT_34310 [Thamnocephalis sphaerospora]|eukprot:RKP09816.1 hypothetical protein THASP1DRAFT_34310 [Thamnocephalis sphaerospora]